jgi:hypothetical protein
MSVVQLVCHRVILPSGSSVVPLQTVAELLE